MQNTILLNWLMPGRACYAAGKDEIRSKQKFSLHGNFITGHSHDLKPQPKFQKEINVGLCFTQDINGRVWDQHLANIELARYGKFRVSPSTSASDLFYSSRVRL